MKDTKHFDAILAKNNIARELRNSHKYKEPVSVSYVLAQLQIIEEYTGELNQPSVIDIFESETSL